MSVYRIYSEKVKGKNQKKMVAVADAEEYRKLRGTRHQQNLVKKAREGKQILWGKNADGSARWVDAKTGLVQFCYSCLPGADGLLAGSTRMSGSVGMDVDLERGAEESLEDFQRRLAEMKTATFCRGAADADGDGDLTIFDATAIQRCLAELPTNENIGKTVS